MKITYKDGKLVIDGENHTTLIITGPISETLTFEGIKPEDVTIKNILITSPPDQNCGCEMKDSHSERCSCNTDNNGQCIICDGKAVWKWEIGNHE